MKKFTAAIAAGALLALAPALPASADEGDSPSVWAAWLNDDDGVFYPLVRDGFEDTMEVAAELDSGSAVQEGVPESYRKYELRWDVIDASGAVVRTARQHWDTSTQEAVHFEWDGRSASGSAMPVGFYTVTATDEAAGEFLFSRRVGVDTATVVEHRSGSLSGSTWRSVSKSGTCKAVKSGAKAVASCRGGAGSVTVRWAAQLPAGAYDVYAGVVGRRTCCSGRSGSVSAETWRDGSLLRARLTVKGWRTYEVSSVRVEYTAKRRI